MTLIRRARNVLRELHESTFLALGNWLPRLSICNRHRWRLYRLAGIAIDDAVVFWGSLRVRPIGGAGNISVGKDSFVNTDCSFGCPVATITIGRRVQIGPGVLFETVNHQLTYQVREGRAASHRSIVVEEEVWIGAGAIITPGVRVGRGSVIMAGAVVTKDVPPGAVAGGVPAQLIRTVSPEVKIGHVDSTEPA